MEIRAFAPWTEDDRFVNFNWMYVFTSDMVRGQLFDRVARSRPWAVLARRPSAVLLLGVVLLFLSTGEAAAAAEVGTSSIGDASPGP